MCSIGGKYALVKGKTEKILQNNELFPEEGLNFAQKDGTLLGTYGA
jgi:hypothetical protein